MLKIVILDVLGIRAALPAGPSPAMPVSGLDEEWPRPRHVFGQFEDEAEDDDPIIQMDAAAPARHAPPFNLIDTPAGPPVIDSAGHFFTDPHYTGT